jgi:hypothetical protein
LKAKAQSLRRKRTELRYTSSDRIRSAFSRIYLAEFSMRNPCMTARSSLRRTCRSLIFSSSAASRCVISFSLCFLHHQPISIQRGYGENSSLLAPSLILSGHFHMGTDKTFPSGSDTLHLSFTNLQRSCSLSNDASSHLRCQGEPLPSEIANQKISTGQRPAEILAPRTAVIFSFIADSENRAQPNCAEVLRVPLSEH